MKVLTAKNEELLQQLSLSQKLNETLKSALDNQGQALLSSIQDLAGMISLRLPDNSPK
jgi:hypothetical protein